MGAEVFVAHGGKDAFDVADVGDANEADGYDITMLVSTNNISGKNKVSASVGGLGA